jgi:tryptophanyl-tRNA synthetase
MQPSGSVHLGNLLGALTSWVALQDEADCVYSVVDLHAITAPDEHDPAALRARTVDLAATLVATGVDPERSVLFVQSHVTEHAQLAWMFNCVATFGRSWFHASIAAFACGHAVKAAVISTALCLSRGIRSSSTARSPRP